MKPKRIVVDEAREEGPRTDDSGAYELLLKSTCPFCKRDVYLAREFGAEHGMVAMHETDGVGDRCLSFDAAMRKGLGDLGDTLIGRASRDEVAAFVERMEGGDKTVH